MNKITIKYYCKLYKKIVNEDKCYVCSASNKNFGECENILPYYSAKKEENAILDIFDEDYFTDMIKDVETMPDIPGYRCPVCGINYLKYPEDEMCVECASGYKHFNGEEDEEL